MIVFPLNEEIDIHFPENWDELTTEQMHWIAENYLSKLQHFIQPCDKEMEEPAEVVSHELMNQLNILLIWQLSGMAWEEFEKMPAIDLDILLHVEQVHLFILNEAGPLKNPVPVCGTLHGPDDTFEDMGADEFFCANAMLENHAETGEAKWMDSFLAVLYRPLDANGQKLPFNLKTVQQHALSPEIKQIDPVQRLLIKLFFDANLADVREESPEAFSGNKKSEGDFVDLMLQVAKDGPFGNFNEVRTTNFRLLMKEMDRVSREIAKMKTPLT